MSRPISKPLPNHILPYAFDFRWDNTLLWNLDISSEIMDINKLIWHFSVAWLHSIKGKFDVLPSEVLLHPDRYPRQYERVMKADFQYPIDIMRNNNR